MYVLIALKGKDIRRVVTSEDRNGCEVSRKIRSLIPSPTSF